MTRAPARKIARWYFAVDGRHLDKIKLADGKRTQLVERGAMVINDLPNAFPDDVDYLQYERMAEKLVTAITEPPEPSPSTIPHAELSSAQGAVLTALQTATEPNLALCQLIDLSRYHADYAAVIKGNKHDTIKALLVRLWLGHCGRLSVADLEWLGRALDESVGHFRSRPQNLRKMCEWVGGRSARSPCRAARRSTSSVRWNGPNRPFSPPSAGGPCVTTISLPRPIQLAKPCARMIKAATY